MANSRTRRKGLEFDKVTDKVTDKVLLNALPLAQHFGAGGGADNQDIAGIAESFCIRGGNGRTDLLGGRPSLRLSRLISMGWAAVLIGIALMFDEGNKAIIMVGLEIASFTYGGLLGLFLLSRSGRTFHPASLGTGLVTAMAAVFALKATGLAWTWYILISTCANIAVTFGVEGLMRSLHSRAPFGNDNSVNQEQP